MNLLESIPEPIFEIFGLVIGFFVCFITIVQIIKEFKSKNKSSLSFGYVFGWVFVYLFWSIYGLRFGALALLITNALALCIQVILCIIVFKKKSNV